MSSRVHHPGCWQLQALVRLGQDELRRRFTRYREIDHATGAYFIRCEPPNSGGKTEGNPSQPRRPPAVASDGPDGAEGRDHLAHRRSPPLSARCPVTSPLSPPPASGNATASPSEAGLVTQRVSAAIPLALPPAAAQPARTARPPCQPGNWYADRRMPQTEPVVGHTSAIVTGCPAATKSGIRCSSRGGLASRRCLPSSESPVSLARRLPCSVSRSQASNLPRR